MSKKGCKKTSLNKLLLAADLLKSKKTASVSETLALLSIAGYIFCEPSVQSK